MTDYTLYDRTTGKIRWHTKGEAREDVLARFDDCDGIIEGHVDGNRFVVINGAPVERGAYASEQAAKAWAELRAERDRRLAACDWTQMPDAPVDSTAWASYRQALRDLPDAVTDISDVPWPELPK